MNDPINPNHYKQGGLESIDAIKAFMSHEAYKGFLKGNCQKYLFRYEKKNGIEDLRKCQWYLERLLGVLEEEEEMVNSTPLQTRQGPPIFLYESGPPVNLTGTTLNCDNTRPDTLWPDAITSVNAR
jgi:hypothetical protein